MSASYENVLKGRNILLSTDNPGVFSEVQQLFTETGATIQLVKDAVQALSKASAGTGAADVIIMEAMTSLGEVFPAIRQIRSQPISPPLFVIVDRTTPNFDEAFYLGVDGIFVKPLISNDVKHGVASTYAELTDHHRRQPRKRLTRFRVSYSAGTQKAFGFAMNVSRGGMFVGSMDWMPTESQKIDFQLSSGSGTDAMKINGHAVVKWHRPKIYLGRPRGFGVEFSDLDPASKEILSKLS